MSTDGFAWGLAKSSPNEPLVCRRGDGLDLGLLHVSADVSIAQQCSNVPNLGRDPQISTVPSQGAPCPDTFEAQSDPLQQNRFGCSVAHWLSQVPALREPCKPSRTFSVSTNPWLENLVITTAPRALLVYSDMADPVCTTLLSCGVFSQASTAH